jgi:pyridoxal phosphate enzyme (YggS family)
MDSITSNIEECRNRISRAAARAGRNSASVLLVAVSKLQTIDAIVAAMGCGLGTFGENYVQELREKQSDPRLAGASWHFIGHLQSNKVKYIAPFVNVIHTVDSISLADEISRQAVKNHRTIDILIQVNTSGEESKSGIEPSELHSLVQAILPLAGIRLRGLMTIPAPKDDVEEVRPEFSKLRELCTEIRERFNLPAFKELSMGMSDDFEVAIEEGATMIRPGTVIFGARQAR